MKPDRGPCPSPGAPLRRADREQPLYINKAGLLPNVTIQVVLDTAGLRDGHNGPSTLLEFPHTGPPGPLRRACSNQENADCVEIALNGSAARVRDSKSQTSSVVAAPDWAAFISAVKRGDFENN